LASSRTTGNQIDVTDVAVAWAAFEEINDVSVTLELAMIVRGANREPRLFGTAMGGPPAGTVLRPSVLASASCWVFEHRSLDAAVFHLLYTLDGLIAAAEFENAAKKEA
jgi:hypothetical protein